MATLYRRKGIWWISYYLEGRRCRESSGTSNKTLAEERKKDVELKIFKGEMGVKQPDKRKARIPDFFRKYVAFIDNNSPIDRHSDHARIRIWREFFARKHIRSLESISPAVIDEFRVEVLNGKKPKIVKNYINILKTALNKAVEWDLIESNPIAKVKPPKTVKTFRFFSHEEIDELLCEAEEPLRTGIFILVSTGMRKGELFHLRWRDVDLKNNKIRIWPYGNYSPKGKRPRSVPISDNLKQILLRLSEEKDPDDFVFRPFKCIHRLYKRFVALLKKLGMEGTLHDLRHTYASHLAMNGTPIPVIKELLGHSDISTTMIYSHLSPELHKAAVDKLPFRV